MALKVVCAAFIFAKSSIQIVQPERCNASLVAKTSNRLVGIVSWDATLTAEFAALCMLAKHF